MKIIIIILLTVLYGADESCAQGHISYETFTSSRLTDELGRRSGSGSMSRVEAGYNIPLSRRQNESGQLTAWSASLYGAYATLDNRGDAAAMSPDDILNCGLNITHIRPVSRRWSVMATVGGGIYAPSAGVTAKSVLVNGGAVFVRRMNRNLDLGFGGGVTNSYGIPMAMPMIYLSWHKPGRYELTVDMMSGLKVSARTWVGRYLSIELAALDMDGMAAVVDDGNGKQQIYSLMMMKSYVSPSYHFGKKVSLYCTVGGNWIRGMKLTERSMKGFADSFKDNSDNPDPYFRPSLRLSAGMRFAF